MDPTKVPSGTGREVNHGDAAVPELERLVEASFSKGAATSRPAALVRRVGGPSRPSSPLDATSTSLVLGQVVERALPPSATPLPPTPVSTSESFPIAKHRSQSAFSLSRSRRKDSKCNPKDHLPSSDADAILASMSPSEVQDAREEVLGRLSSKHIDFLKRRGRDKVVNNSLKEVLESGGAQGRYDLAAHTSRLNPPDQGGDIPEAGTTDAAGRIRFDLDGNPVGWCEDQTPQTINRRESAESSAVSRDPLRCAEGSVPSNGYTIKEAIFLTRSTVHQQRVVGFRVLEAVLDAFAPLGRGCTPLTLRPVEQEHRKSVVPLSTTLTNEDVWNHAVGTADVVLAIRAGLDDRNDSVILAAARAMEALLQVNSDRLQSPSGHGISVRYISRRKETGPWEAFPVNPDGDSDGQAFNEREIAKIDPAIGLINMRLLDRIAFLLSLHEKSLTTKSESEQHIDASLVRTLGCIARLGPDVCEKVASTPGLVASLLNRLPDQEHCQTSKRSVQSTTQLVHQLKAIKYLCRSSAKICETVVLSYNSRITALMALMSESSTIVAECLGIWRSIVDMGKEEGVGCAEFGSLEDYFPVLQHYLCPPLHDTALRSGHHAVCELYMLMAALLRKSALSNTALISAAAVRAVFASTVSWLVEYEDEIAETLDASTTTVSEELESECSSDTQLVLLEVASAALQYVCSVLSVVDDQQDESVMILKSLLSGKIRTAVKHSLPLSLSNAKLFPITASLARRVNVAMEYSPSSKSHVHSFAHASVLHPWDAPYVYYTLLYYRSCFCCDDDDDGDHHHHENTILESGRDALDILSRLPPGGEDVAMLLMTALFHRNLGKGALERGRECARGYLQRKGIGSDHIEVEAMSFLHRSTQSTECVDLLHGYTSSWRLGDSRNPQNPVGSYLPLPETWMLCQSPSALPDNTALRLLWVLGMVDLGHLVPSLSLAKSAIDMIFGGVQDSSFGSDAMESSQAWREDMVKFSLAALVDTCMLRAEHQSTASAEDDQRYQWTMPQAQHLVSEFASVSYGDWVFGAAVGTLLLPAWSPMDVQLEALTLLTEERVLHLLPPIDRCFGRKKDYFGSVDLSSMSSIRAQQEVYLKILGTPEFVEAIDQGTVGGLVIVHRLAWMIFMRQEDEGLMLRAARRLKSLGPEKGRHIFNALLAWKPDDGCSYPTIPRRRHALCSLFDDLID